MGQCIVSDLGAGNPCRARHLTDSPEIYMNMNDDLYGISRWEETELNSSLKEETAVDMRR